jgi:hypothetical protein
MAPGGGGWRFGSGGEGGEEGWAIPGRPPQRMAATTERSPRASDEMGARDGNETMEDEVAVEEERQMEEIKAVIVRGEQAIREARSALRATHPPTRATCLPQVSRVA